MAIRGIGDAALDVISDQNRERAQAASLSEQNRQARVAEEQKNRQLTEQERSARAAEAMHTAEFGERRRVTGVEIAQRDRQLTEQERSARAAETSRGEDRNITREQFIAKQDEERRQFDENLGMAKSEAAQREEMFQRTKKLWEEEDAKRQQAMSLQSGAFANLVRASLFSPGAPEPFIRAFNEAAGVETGKPGSIVGSFRLSDANGHSSGVGYVTIDKDGKQQRNILTPEQVWSAMGVYPPETQKMITEEYSKRYNVNDPMNLAKIKYMTSQFDLNTAKAEDLDSPEKKTFGKDTYEALKKEMAGVEKQLASPNLTMTEKTRLEARKAMLTKRLDESLGIASGTDTSTAKGAAPKAGGTATAGKPRVWVDGERIYVTENGKTKWWPKNEKTIDAAKSLGYDLGQ